MGSGDLNLKKQWHPLTFKNQEMVWLAERRQEQEERKMEQLKKELEQERGTGRLESSNRNRVDRLDWMYTGPAAVGLNSVTSEQKEQFLLGKKRVDTLVETGLTAEELRPHRAFTLTEAAVYGFQANSWKDTQNKIREDPLLAIKRREGASLQAVMANPLKMREMMDKKKKKKERKSEKVDDGESVKRGRSRSNEGQAERMRDVKVERDRRDERSGSRDKYRRRSPSTRQSRSPPRRLRSRSPPHRKRSHTPPRRSTTHNQQPRHASQTSAEKAQTNAKKLQEMQDNASIHRERRDERVREYERDDAREMAVSAVRGDRGDAFVREMRLEGLERRR